MKHKLHVCNIMQYTYIANMADRNNQAQQLQPFTSKYYNKNKYKT